MKLKLNRIWPTGIALPWHYRLTRAKDLESRLLARLSERQLKGDFRLLAQNRQLNFVVRAIAAH